MLKIGITGGIGSGKTTVCEIWEKQGAKIINADVLAKQLMTQNEALKQQIVNKFGSKSYKKNGDLNRAYLAEQIFNQGRAEELEQIVHPAVFNETDRLIQQTEKEGYGVLVYEAAILLQKGRPEKMDQIVLVLADENKRIDRVSERDQANKNDIGARINKQQNYKALIPLADIVIQNNGSLKELQDKAVDLYKELIPEG